MNCCVSVVNLFTFSSDKLSDNIDGFDRVGMAVSIYFRLLRFIIFFFMGVVVLSILPLFLLGGGKANQDVNTPIDKILTSTTIGNLGET